LNSIKFILIIISSIFLATVFISPALAAAQTPSKCVVTIQSVYLQNEGGDWIKIIEPDRQVDLISEEAGLSFFNQGRVPPGKYTNFKIILFERIKVESKDLEERYLFLDSQAKDSDDEVQIYGRINFKEPFSVKKGSFIGVWFSLNLENTLHVETDTVSFIPPEDVTQATVMIDDQTLLIPSQDIILEF